MSVPDPENPLVKEKEEVYTALLPIKTPDSQCFEITFTLVLPDGKKGTVVALPTDMLYDLKLFITDTREMCLATSFEFFHQGKVCPEFIPIDNIPGLVDDPILHIKYEKYNELSAKTHTRKFRDLIDVFSVNPTGSVLPQLSEHNEIFANNPPAVDFSYDQSPQPQPQSQLQKQEEKKQPEEQEKQPEEQEKQPEEQEKQPEEQEKQLQVPEVQRESQPANLIASDGGAQGKKKKKKKKKKGPAKKKEPLAVAAEQINTESLENIPVEPSLPKISNSEIKEILSAFDEFKMSELLPKKELNSPCLIDLSPSGWNPPSSNRLYTGDLFYLELETLENERFFITCSRRGFFVNQSTRQAFNPNPISRIPIFYKICDLIGHLSPKFRVAFQQILDSHFIKTIGLDRVPTGAQVARNLWLGSPPPVVYGRYRSDSASQFLSEIELLSMQHRDWNEEYATALALPFSTVEEKIARDRNLYKISMEFSNVSVLGVHAIFHNNLPPINLNDIAENHMYVFNNIFFSRISCDNNLITDSYDVAYKLANNELLGGTIINRFQHQLRGNPILTCVIDFMGFRIISQSIIAGLLSRESPNDIFVHGSIDGGHTAYFSDDFKKDFETITNFHSPVHTVTFSNGQKLDFSASVHAKGIVGDDRRQYLLDFVCPVARDFNFPEMQNAIVRPELIDSYLDFQRARLQKELLENKSPELEKELDQLMKDVEEEVERRIKAVYDCFKKTTEEVRSSSSSSSSTSASTSASTSTSTSTSTSATDPLFQGEQENPEDKVKEEELPTVNSARKQELKNSIYKEKLSQKLERSVSQLLKDLGINLFIPNIEPNGGICRYSLDHEDENIKKGIENLKQLALFVLETHLPTLANSITSNFSEGATLTRFMHVQGINLRYLGRLAELIQPNEDHLYPLIVSEIIVRSAKHIYNSSLRSVAFGDISSFVAHFLNTFFSHFSDCSSEESPSESSSAPAAAKKSAKKSQQEQNVSQKNSTGSAERFNISKDSFWKQLQQEAEKRFRFNLDKDVMIKSIHDFGFVPQLLRNFCRKTGITLEIKDYDMNHGMKIFQPENIVKLNAILKHNFPVSHTIETLIASSRSLFSQRKFQESFERINEALRFGYRVYGPIHSHTADCYDQLTALYLEAGDLGETVANLSKFITITERLEGFDSIEVVHSYANLANLFIQVGRFRMAFKYLKHGLQLSHFSLGPINPESTIMYSYLTLFLQQYKRYKEALVFQRKILEISEKMYGEDDPNTGQCLHQMAIIHNYMDEFREALNYERRNHEILLSKCGENDPETIESAIWLKQFTALAVQKQRQENVKANYQLPLTLVAENGQAEQKKKNRKSKGKVNTQTQIQTQTQTQTQPLPTSGQEAAQQLKQQLQILHFQQQLQQFQQQLQQEQQQQQQEKQQQQQEKQQQQQEKQQQEQQQQQQQIVGASPVQSEQRLSQDQNSNVRPLIPSVLQSDAGSSINPLGTIPISELLRFINSSEQRIGRKKQDRMMLGSLSQKMQFP